MQSGKKYFGYAVYHGKVFPAKILQASTDRHGVIKNALKQIVELKSNEIDLGLDELSKIYPYKEEKKDEKASYN